MSAVETINSSWSRDRAVGSMTPLGSGLRPLVASPLLRHGSPSAFCPLIRCGLASTSGAPDAVVVPSGATSSAARNGCGVRASTRMTLVTPPGGKLALKPCCGAPCHGGGASLQAASRRAAAMVIDRRRIVMSLASFRLPACDVARTRRQGKAAKGHGGGDSGETVVPRCSQKQEGASMDGASPATRDLGTVEDRFFTIGDFRLANCEVMPEATIAYETYGALAPDGRNAVLCTHGFTGSHRFAGRNPANGGQPGSWDGLIGPGKAIDTEKLFVVASNMLGSSFGSTNAASPNPKTGQPYGPDFPAITIRDIVGAQKLLLDSLGVKHLVAVAGPSYGGYQGFQWAVAYPDFMDGIVAVNTAPWASVNTDKQLADVTAKLETDPEWRGGRYHGKGLPLTALTGIRVETLKRYGADDNLKPRFPDPAEREAAIREQAAAWAAKWDAHSLIILRRALLGFD